MSVLITADTRRRLRMSHRQKLVKKTDLPGEKWRLIPGWPDIYEVSNFGRVCEDRYLVLPFPSDIRYTRLFDGTESKRVSVASLVLRAFVGPPPTATSLARHLDDDPTNNKLSNVAWGSKRDNTVDAIRNGKLIYTAERNRKISMAKKGVPATTPVWNKGLIYSKNHPMAVTLRTVNIGTRWINDQTIERKIKKDETIPDGWCFGRLGQRRT
jgi:hypothetical protein